MRVLVFGGTGSIGRAVVGELHRRGHSVTILCRSDSAANRAQMLGAAVLHGSIAKPAHWIHRLSDADAVIHLATGFGPDAGGVDRQLLDAVFDHEVSHRRAAAANAAPTRVRFIYTGGMWLFGSCSVAPSPNTPYQTPAFWQWAADGCRRVLSHPKLHSVVVHPANVIDDDAGVPPIILTDAKATGHIRMPIPEGATWPLVRRDILAQLYVDALEHATPGAVYFGVSEEAVPRSELVRRTAQATGLPAESDAISIDVWQQKYGDWAVGYGLSQKARDQRLN
ncbi:MAG TPA: NAD(P)H-binding protein [Alkalispirochaeta sp.]|nr:NAD(P)H-binding protein [Alkalispirochaeta sp.]